MTSYNTVQAEFSGVENKCLQVEKKLKSKKASYKQSERQYRAKEGQISKLKIENKRNNNSMDIGRFERELKELKTEMESEKEVIDSLEAKLIEMNKSLVLHSIFWKRIVCDEGYLIKNFQSKTHNPICKLNSKYRWFMTGTHIQNSIDDLFAAFQFLKYSPYDTISYWKRFVPANSNGNYIQHSNDNATKWKKIRNLLEPIMLRRLRSDIFASTNGNKNEISNASKDSKRNIVESPQEFIKRQMIESAIKKNNNNSNNIGTKVKLPPKRIVTHLIDFNER